MEEKVRTDLCEVPEKIRLYWIFEYLSTLVCVKGTNKEHFLGYYVGFKNSEQLPNLDWE